MSWDQVRQVLLEEIIVLMRDPAKGREWLNQLEYCEDGKRLGACIVIDTLSGAMKSKAFADILEGIDLLIGDSRRAFGAVAGDPPDPALICASCFEGDDLDAPDAYARVVELGGFIDYYVGPVYHRSSLDPEDVNDVRADFFMDGTNENWPDLNVEWSGRFGRVFVSSRRELDQLLLGVPENERGTMVNDALGLGFEAGVGPDGKAELVAVQYPTSVALRAYQPTTFDVPWLDPGGYYISFGNVDRWGRTQSCSGTKPQVRERVHKGFGDSLSHYQGLYIGVSLSVLDDQATLLRESFRRVTELLAS